MLRPGETGPLRPVNKNQIRNLVVARLREELALQIRAAQLSREEATSEESRAENQYDMHSQEAAYLAEGQARLAAEIAVSVELWASLALSAFGPDTPIAVGAAVALETGQTRSLCFLGARGGGIEVEVEGVKVLVVTPQSPLGRELVGKKVGALAKLPGGPPARIAEVI
jgi:transcription elongation GreA/GreB family factor